MAYSEEDDTLGGCSSVFYTRENLLTSCLLSCRNSRFWKFSSGMHHAKSSLGIHGKQRPWSDCTATVWSGPLLSVTTITILQNGRMESKGLDDILGMRRMRMFEGTFSLYVAHLMFETFQYLLFILQKKVFAVCYSVWIGAGVSECLFLTQIVVICAILTHCRLKTLPITIY